MKKAIKFFSVTIFLICFLPMFQTCSDKTILKQQFSDEQIVDSSESPDVIKRMNDSLKKVNHDQRLNELERVRKDYTLNGYQLAFSGYREFEIEDLKDWTFYPTLCFTISMLISLIILILALKNKIAKVFKLSIFNLILVVGSMTIFVFAEGLEIIKQIKYGYYILLLNILLLIILSRLCMKNCR